MVDPKDLDDYGNDLFENLGKLQQSKTQNEYEQLACELWKKLKLEDQLIKNIPNKNRMKMWLIKAVLIKAVKRLFIVIPKNQNEDNLKNAAFYDLALIMFDLLESQYYFGCESDMTFISYRERYKLYLSKNIYTESRLASPNISQWRRRIRSTIADYLSKQDDVHKYLKKAKNEYIACGTYGKYTLILQKPYLTTKNFPSLIQKDFSECDKGYQPRKTAGALSLFENNVQKYYALSLISAEQYESIIQGNKNEEGNKMHSSDGSINTLPALGALAEQQHLYAQKDTEKLSLIKSDDKLLNNVRFKKIINVFCKISRNFIQPVYLALTIMAHSINPNHELFQQLNQFNIATTQNVYNEENPDFTVKTTFKTLGWRKDTTLSVGDRVEFQIAYTNTGKTTQRNVIIDDDLPTNLKYVEGTTKLYDGLYPTGTVLTNNSVTGDGIIIGDYTAGSNALVRFQAEVVDEDFTCGKFILHNWGRATVGQTVIQDSAAVNVALASCSDPENDTDI